MPGSLPLSSGWRLKVELRRGSGRIAAPPADYWGGNAAADNTTKDRSSEKPVIWASASCQCSGCKTQEARLTSWLPGSCTESVHLGLLAALAHELVLCLIHFASKVGAAPCIGVVQDHELAVGLAHGIHAGALADAEDLGCLRR